MKSLLSFVLIGSFGLGVDLSLCTWLIDHGDWPPALGRGFSLAIAISLTWLLNRHLTFAAHRQACPKREFGHYQLVQLGGMGLNYMAFSLALPSLSGSAYGLQLAVMLGSLSGLAWNFTGLRFWVYPDRRRGGEKSLPSG